MADVAKDVLVPRHDCKLVLLFSLFLVYLILDLSFQNFIKWSLRRRLLVIFLGVIRVRDVLVLVLHFLSILFEECSVIIVQGNLELVHDVFRILVWLYRCCEVLLDGIVHLLAHLIFRVRKLDVLHKFLGLLRIKVAGHENHDDHPREYAALYGLLDVFVYFLRENHRVNRHLLLFKILQSS